MKIINLPITSTHSKVQFFGKLSNTFFIKTGIKQENLSLTCLTFIYRKQSWGDIIHIQTQIKESKYKEKDYFATVSFGK